VKEVNCDFYHVINEVKIGLNKDNNAYWIDKFKHNDYDIHIAILCEPYITYVLSGKKTIESRFSRNKSLPFNRVNKNDIVILKESGGDYLGLFEVNEVKQYSFRDNDEPLTVFSEYLNELCVDSDWIDSKKNSKYATLIFIKNVAEIKPFNVAIKNRQAWLVINKGIMANRCKTEAVNIMNYGTLNHNTTRDKNLATDANCQQAR
jgi:ASC-1-like (ASCH) protein